MIGSGLQLKLGHLYQGLGISIQTILPCQWYKVIKKSTLEEWVDCVLEFLGEQGIPKPDKEEIRALAKTDGHRFFYEIQTD